MKEKLKLGTAYHSNRILRHVEEDMVDIVNHNMNLVVHMLTHNDMDRHWQVMKDVVEISEEKGLEVWVDNWGIDCGPGDKAYFTGICPEAKAMFSDGTPSRLKPCYNSPEFRAFTREWIDMVSKIGGKAIFWDEPHLESNGEKYTCWCPRCRKMFEEKYNRPMPALMDPDVAEFRTATIVDYFTEMTNYAHEKGLINTGCIMFSASHGISLDSIDRMLAIPHFDNVGCDPYWCGRVSEAPDIYEYVYSRSKKGVDTANQFGKDHNIWIQAYSFPAGREDEIVIASEAAYDAGARTILTWSFRGGESNNYRAANTDRIWQITGEAFGRLRSRWYDEIMADIRKKY
ncbi:MAG: hypothetical protein E7662_12015 [Ruminococcaceae bacterium]|nr:hypothetical protein [Oscillospiraceae bacterium]